MKIWKTGEVGVRDDPVCFLFIFFLLNIDLLFSVYIYTYMEKSDDDRLSGKPAIDALI